MRILIDDLDDPRIAIYRRLKRTNETRRLDQFVVEGEKLVERLIDSRFPVVSVLATDRHERVLRNKIPEGVPAYVVPDGMIDDLVGFPFHRGVLGCGQRKPWPALSQIVRDGNRAGTFVICPKLSDPENLGTIARIGDVFGIDAILAGEECPDPLSRRVLRVSMGAVLRLPVIVSENQSTLPERLVEESQLELWGAVADPRAQPFDHLARPDRLGLVLGDEDRGIEPQWLKRCRRIVTIPMRPGAGSLNVAVAAGILLYSLTRDARRLTAQE